MEIPETRYAKTADGVHIAYQVVGSGPLDMVFVIGWTSHIELMWTEPALARFLMRLASFSRLILFDKRGMGLSDRVSPEHLPSLEVRMDDAHAVMDEIGSDRAVVFGVSEGGPMATLFAATYPERTIALVLFGTSASWRGGDDYPFPVASDSEFERMIEEMDRAWGTRELAAKDLRTWAAPSLASDERATAWLAEYERNSASPAARHRSRTDGSWDRRPSSVAGDTRPNPGPLAGSGPSLSRRGDEVDGRADTRGSVRFIPRRGPLLLGGAQDELLDELERFVAQVRGDEADLDRMLATVMFTDIVGSTAKAAELGDRAWRQLVERHHGTVRALLGRFRGHEIDNSGDGFFATFDGPARGVRCTQEIGGAVRHLRLEVRAGIHTGEVETIAGEVGGIAVNVGARIASLAGPSEVLVSSTVRDLVSGSGLTFEDAGEHKLKGVPDRWHLYRVQG